MEAKVYFYRLANGSTAVEQAYAIDRLYAAAGAAAVIAGQDLVAIKLHVGEGTNTTRVKPEVIAQLVKRIKSQDGFPYLTETSTLYKGERHNAVKHLTQAHRQGFGIEKTGAPFLMADGLVGNTEYEIDIPGELHKTVKVARETISADALFVVSHATGCISTGLGACIKNLGMGLASRPGKMRQHSAVLPSISSDHCRYCQKCMKWCPAGAIIEKNGKAFIVADKCLGCGECIAVCKFDAVKYDFSADNGFLQKSMAEHAYGAIIGKPGKCFYFNVLTNITQECDCRVKGPDADLLIPDLGILASDDPVAIDKATQDLTAEAHGHPLGHLAFPQRDAMIQIEHAAKIGMGSLKYELIEINRE